MSNFALEVNKILGKRDCMVNLYKHWRTWRYIWHILIWLVGVTSSTCFLYVIWLNVNHATILWRCRLSRESFSKQIKSEFSKAIKENNDLLNFRYIIVCIFLYTWYFSSAKVSCHIKCYQHVIKKHAYLQLSKEILDE